VADPRQVKSEWLTFRASRALVDRVDQLAQGDDRSRSYVLRELVTEGIGLDPTDPTAGEQLEVAEDDS
jgi:predicted transcriptional regulator